MADDLEARGRQVHDNAAAVLDFWFALAPERHWEKALDCEIADRFGAMRDAVLTSGATGWRESPDTLLAAIILLDQFSRNIHRGQAEAFAGDDLAMTLTLRSIEQGWERRYPPERRAFLYMPLEHAEDMPLQRLSLDRFAVLGLAENLEYARAHAAVIERFGRFPGRNAALGRRSTPEEKAYLAQPGADW